MIQLVPISSESHWEEVDRIQRLAYSEELLEDLDVLKEKAAIEGHFCFLICDEFSANVLGYVLAHPYPKNEVPPLNSKELAPPKQTESNVFIHDLALDPSCSGRGVGKLAVDSLIAAVKAKHMKSMTLIAVQSSSHFWNKAAGFESVMSADISRLSKYGDGAKMMHVEF